LKCGEQRGKTTPLELKGKRNMTNKKQGGAKKKGLTLEQENNSRAVRRKIKKEGATGRKRGGTNNDGYQKNGVP